MSRRLGVLTKQIVPCSSNSPRTAPFDSPQGKVYPEGTALTLMGNMEPVYKELTGDLELLFGTIPYDINGQFIRNGPNPWLDMFGKPYHEFEADGMLHMVEFNSGHVNYSNKWVNTTRLQIQQKKGRPLSRMETFDKNMMYQGSANTALVHHAGQLLALQEVDRPYIISESNLKTMGQLTFQGKLKHPMTAHPKVCPLTGDLVFFGYELLKPCINYAVADSNSTLVESFEIPTQNGKPVMMHDMAITRRYSILPEFPLYFEQDRASKGAMPYVHDTSLPTRFAILPRHAQDVTEIKWFTAKTGMCFHMANAWEEGDVVKLVGCQSKYFSFDYGSSAQAWLYEWSFNLQTGEVTERVLDNTSVEFPVIHPCKTGIANRFVFCACFTGGAPPFHSIEGCIKYDLVSGKSYRHDFIQGRFGGECVFIPREGGSEEDDGYLMTYTFDPSSNTTELYIIDASTMQADPVAILRTPQRVPFGFHGIWVPCSRT